MTIVVDSWAVLAALLDEPPVEAMRQLLDSPPDEPVVMSWINLGEVVYRLRRERHDPDDIDATVRDLRAVVDVELPDEALVLAAAEIKASHAMAYADAFCAATAVRHDAVLWTGDPELLGQGVAWRWRDLRPLSPG